MNPRPEKEVPKTVSGDFFHSLSKGTQDLARRVGDQIEATDRQIRMLQDSLRSLKKAQEALLSAGLGAGAPDEGMLPEIEEAEPTDITGRRSTRGRRSNSLAARIRSEARSVLIQSGGPMDRAELLVKLRATGIDLPEKTAKKRIGKVLWGSKEFVHVGSGYWLADVPVPTKTHEEPADK